MNGIGRADRTRIREIQGRTARGRLDGSGRQGENNSHGKDMCKAQKFQGRGEKKKVEGGQTSKRQLKIRRDYYCYQSLGNDKEAEEH